ncbi:MAG: SGNH/GDSL hydrolase family protein [Hyphomicrobiaceae bacterium]
MRVFVFGMVFIAALTSVGAAQAPPPPVQPNHPLQLPSSPPNELQYSRECRTPGLTMSGHTQLPAVARALRERKPLTILTIGASSSGGRTTGDSSYYDIIEQMLEKTVPGLDVRIIDRGVSGELASEASQRLMTEVALLKPDLVLWQLGTHDALMQVPVSDFKQTVTYTLTWLKDHHIDVVLVGMHYLRGLAKDPHYQAIRSTLAKVAEKFNVLRIRRYEAMQMIDQARKAADGAPRSEFNATEEGYSCLSEYVARAVTSGLFTRKTPANAKPRI